MHGAVLLDQHDQPLRPAILWNDGRAAIECEELEASVPLREITGNCAMPGFTAPKLLWTRKHEPQPFHQTTKVLLPKDYVRLRMTGVHATDMSDASGTLWLNVRERRWDDRVLDATGLKLTHMPTLFEGSDVTELLSKRVASRWHIQRVPVVGWSVRPSSRRHRFSCCEAGLLHTVARDIRRVVLARFNVSSEPRGRGSQFLPCLTRHMASNGSDFVRLWISGLGHPTIGWSFGRRTHQRNRENEPEWR